MQGFKRPWLSYRSFAWLAILSIAGTMSLAAESIFFSRDFPGSIPPYFEALVDSDGLVTYRESMEEDPITFRLAPDAKDAVFHMVRELDNLRANIPSSRNVAFTGNKILRYEDGNGDSVVARFTYTENATARDLVSWFLKVAETQRHLFELERTARFDRLGVNKALLNFQISFDKDRIVAASQFLPILNKIASGKKYLHIASSRAASLVERIERGGRRD